MNFAENSKENLHNNNLKEAIQEKLTADLQVNKEEHIKADEKHDSKDNSKGCFYAVSVGPGNPELMTLQAVKLLQNAPVLAIPVNASGSRTAYDIASQVVDFTEKEIVELQTVMSKDKTVLEQIHRKQAEQLRPYLDQGTDVAMLSLGDVSIYSTALYILEILEKEGYPVRMFAGVPSFCAAAAELNISLTEMESPIHVIPAPYVETKSALNLPGTKIFMKSGKSLTGLLAALEENGQTERAYLAANVGLPNQLLSENLAEIEIMPGYFTTVIVK